MEHRLDPLTELGASRASPSIVTPMMVPPCALAYRSIDGPRCQLRQLSDTLTACFCLLTSSNQLAHQTLLRLSEAG